MADNFVTNSGSGGSTFRAEQIASGANSGTLVTVTKVQNGAEANAQNGWTPGRLLSAASTNLTSVTSAATQLGYLLAINTGSSIAYLKLYNKASAPVPGTDTPVHTIPIPASTSGAGIALPIPTGGIAFSTGFALAITGAEADNDTTAIAANQVTLNYGTA